MRQFEIDCSRCGRRKRVRVANFVKTTYEWKSGGSTLICPECAKGCNVITSRDQTIQNMVREMFNTSNMQKGD